MTNQLLVVVTVFISFSSSHDKDLIKEILVVTEPKIVVPESTDKKSGFVLVTSGESKVFAQCFESVSTGIIDNSAGKSFPSFNVRYKNGIYTNGIEGTFNNVTEAVVDEKGAFVDTTIPTVCTVSGSVQVEDGVAYYLDRNEIAIITFDPEIKKVTGSIELSSVFRDNKTQDSMIRIQRYRDSIVRGDTLFLRYSGNKKGAKTDSLLYRVVDLSSGTYQETIPYTGTQGAFSFKGNRDEDGNIWISTGVNRPKPLVKQAIAKIPAGSTDFDKSYLHNYTNDVQYAEQLIQLNGRFDYAGDGIAYSLGSVTFPHGIVDLIAAKPNKAHWKLKRYNTALSTQANVQWWRMALNAQTTTIIPKRSMIALNTWYECEQGDGEMYFSIANTEENVVYNYDENTSKSEKNFGLSNGGAIIGFSDLAKEYESLGTIF